MPILVLRPRTGTTAPPPPPAVPTSGPSFVARARYTLEVAWEGVAAGTFRLGTSLLGGTHTLALSPFDITFTGPYDNLSPFLREATVDRGVGPGGDRMTAATATFRARDPDGRFNPRNQGGPLYGLLAERRQQIRWRGHVDTTVYPLFYGFVENLEWTALRRGPGGYVEISCRDLFTWLEDTYPVITATGPTTTGTAIGKVLDSAGWTDPASRSLETGDLIPDFAADGTKTSLQLIRDLLEAERGTFFIARDGKATYRSRTWALTRNSAATIVGQMVDARPSLDHTRTANKAQVKRTQNNYVATAEDIGHRSRFGPRDIPLLESAYLASDSTADSLAAQLLAHGLNPRSLVREFAIDNRTPELLVQVLGRELGDVVTAVTEDVGLAEAFQIQRVRHDLRGVRHTATWALDDYKVIDPFTIGASLLSPNAATDGPVLV